MIGVGSSVLEVLERGSELFMEVLLPVLPGQKWSVRMMNAARPILMWGCASCPLLISPAHTGLITGAGARHLAAALSSNSTLQELNLSQNPIGDVGGCAIADALCKNKTLTVLQLKKVSRIGAVLSIGSFTNKQQPLLPQRTDPR